MADESVTTPARDGCVVETEPLASMLRGFMDTWARTRLPRTGRYSGPKNRRVTADDQVSPVSALEWLSSTSGVEPKTIAKITRKTGAPKTTELRIADSLVMALNRPEAFVDGTLTVRPNMRVPREDRERAQCCAGSRPTFEPWSLNGSLD